MSSTTISTTQLKLAMRKHAMYRKLRKQGYDRSEIDFAMACIHLAANMSAREAARRVMDLFDPCRSELVSSAP